MFNQGDRWAQNGTLDQLKGFDLIRMSSYVSLNEMSTVTGEGKQLMIAVAGEHYNETNHPDSVLAQYDRGEGPLKSFEDFVDTLASNNIQVSAWFYNIEVPGNALNYFGYDSTTVAGKRQAAGRFATMIKKYIKISEQLGRYPNAKTWTYGRNHEPDHNGNSIQEGRELWELNQCVDYDSLTTGPYPVDVVYIGSPINILEPEIEKGRIEDWIVWTKSVLGDSSIVSWQEMQYGALNPGDPNYDPEESPIWNEIQFTYHHRWEDQKDILRHIVNVLDSVNADVLPIFNLQKSPIAHYKQYHYILNLYCQSDPNHPDTVYTFTNDDYSHCYDPYPPDIPFLPGTEFPARFWEESHDWEWGKVVNKWELEFVTNFLAATGYAFPDAAKKILQSTTWSGNIALLSDIIIPSGVKLTIAPSTTVTFRHKTDLFSSGDDTTMAEIIIEPGGELFADASNDARIVFQPSPSDSSLTEKWHGIRNEGGKLTLKNCLIRSAVCAVQTLDTQMLGGDVIQDCEFIDNNEGISVHSSSAVDTLAGNAIRETSKGIYLLNQSSVSIRNCLIHDNATTGIKAESVGFLKIKNATFSQAPRALTFENTGDMHVEISNTIFAHGTGGYSAIYYEAGDTTTFSLGLTYSDIYAWGGSEFDGAAFTGWDYPDYLPLGNEGDIADDPLFTSLTQDNYHLRSNSPCVDTGDTSMTDPDGTQINMGRYGGTSGAAKAAGFVHGFRTNTSGWAMLSLPVAPPDSSLTAVWSDAISAFSYKGGYVQAYKILPGLGYWVDSNQGNYDYSYTIPGGVEAVFDTTFTSSGWQLLGAPWNWMLVSSIEADPPDMITSVFKFEGGYQQVDTLFAGVGYWFNLAKPGNLRIFSKPATKPVSPPGRDKVIRSEGTLWAESEGVRQKILLGVNPEHLVELPPVPPEGVFDARVQVKDDYGSARVPVRDQPETYPVQIQGKNVRLGWDDWPAPESAETLWQLLVDGTAYDLMGSGTVDLETGATEVFVRRGFAHTGSILEYGLSENYPNPFNPVTHISYQIPRAGQVSLTIYNILGQQVRALVSEYQEVGAYNVAWDSRDDRGRVVSSGIYFYKFKSGDFHQTHRMLLLK